MGLFFWAVIAAPLVFGLAQIVAKRRRLKGETPWNVLQNFYPEID